MSRFTTGPVQGRSAAQAAGALPPVLAGRRRWFLIALVGLGLLQAALSVVIAFLTPQLFAGNASVGLSLLLVAAGLAVGGARIGERVLSEDLGQDYVREVRRLLVTSALAPARSTNIGTTVARTTNDLTAVKNWVSLGISPIVTGVPLIAGVLIAMLLLTPALAVVVAVTLGALAVLLVVLSPPLYRRARRLRRVRGAMAGQIADTVIAGQSIRVSGGIDREVDRIDKLSGKVAREAHSRAEVSGAMRGAAASATAILAVVVAVAGVQFDIPATQITTAVFIAGLLATPVADLGRVGEYRQGMRAAHTVLAPVIARARAHQELERRRRRERRRTRYRGHPAGLARNAVHVADLVDRNGRLPDLVAAPGSRVLLVGSSAARVEAVLAHLTGDRADGDRWVVVDGRHVGSLPATERRRLVGFASRVVPIERGTVSRVVRYRVPDTETPVEDLLDRVGLRDRVAELPDGVKTTLRRGGDPLGVGDQARLRLARAIADDPPLVVLDHLDEQLDPTGRALLRDILADYPGCVILRSNNPTAVLDCYDVWNVDETEPRQVIAVPVRDIPTRGPRATTYAPGHSAHPFGPPVARSVVDAAARREESGESVKSSATTEVLDADE